MFGFNPAINPQAVLASVPADMAELFEQYRKGQLKLRVYRNSTPHNWWLEPVDRPGETAYHWPEGYAPGKAFLAFAHKLPSTGMKVSYGGWMRGSDEGMPVHDSWLFDSALYDSAVERWTYALECAKSFNEMADSRTPDVWALSSMARWHARKLKRDGRGEMHNNASSVEELVAMGFATVTPEGYYCMTPALKKQVIPREDKYTQQLAA